MIKLDFEDLETSVSEYQRRQGQLITAVAWMLTQNGLGVAESLKALGIKPSKKWMKSVSEFGSENIEK